MRSVLMSFICSVAMINCATETDFSSQLREDDNPNLQRQGQNGDGNGDSIGGEVVPATAPTPPKKQQPEEVKSGVLTITDGSYSFDDATDTVTVEIKVIDAQSNPVADVAVVFDLEVDNGASKTNVNFAQVTTNSKGIAQASKVVSVGITSDTIQAWELKAELNSNAAVTVIEAESLKMGRAYTYSWSGDAACSTNVVRLKVNAEGNPMTWPASISQGDSIRAMVLPTAGSGTACIIGYYKLEIPQHPAAFVGTTPPATVNIMCESRATCWDIGNNLAKWSTINQAQSNQNWIYRGHVTGTYMLFATN